MKKIIRILSRKKKKKKKKKYKYIYIFLLIAKIILFKIYKYFLKIKFKKNKYIYQNIGIVHFAIVHFAMWRIINLFNKAIHF